MAFLTGTTRGGTEWIPTFADNIDVEKCIGCGRCYKACSREVLAPEDIEDEENYTTRMIMTVATPDDCIGCGGCGSTCPKKCFSFIQLEV